MKHLGWQLSRNVILQLNYPTLHRLYGQQHWLFVHVFRNLTSNDQKVAPVFGSMLRRPAFVVWTVTMLSDSLSLVF